MIKDVIIKIKGVQSVNSEEEVTEFTTDGRFGFKDGDAFISYDESDMIGAKGVKTVCSYRAPDTVVIKRTGAIESRMVIGRNQKIACNYQTAYGQLMLNIAGESLVTDFNEHGGSLSMSYRIDVNNKILSRNKIEITVREV